MLKIQNFKNKPSKIPKNDPCKGCGAVCCHDLAIHILRPRDKATIEELKWYLHFDTIRIFIRNRKWHIVIEGRCIYLDNKNQCKIYKNRPDKCRQHAAGKCERYVKGMYWQILIETPEQLDKYLKR